MTNKEDNGDTSDSCLASLLAVHLVSQVLEEASIVANAAIDSGQPWRHLSMFKNFKSGKLSESDNEDVSFVAKGDTDAVNENKMEQVANIVATSTPQKVTVESRRPGADTGFIGQGDEDLEMHQNELSKSTSMFLNHLFNMSEVERVVVCDDTDLASSQAEPDDLLTTQAMTKIMESYINTALGMAYDQNTQINDIELPIESSSTEHSEYSFLADAFTVDIGRDVAFYIHDDATDDANKYFKPLHLMESVEITELNESNTEESINKNDVARYEHAYLTMNRDFDQCSDDDADPVLQDPKGMTLQEVELMTANTSEENVSAKQDLEDQSTCKQKELTATSAVSAATSGSKKSLANRCRTQGARLLACIRGWWRRKTPGKRKEARIAGTLRGICPLSPDARRRASSLLDQRLLRSPSPSSLVVWKFNTVNESLVNSSRWKDYTFDTQPDGGGEY